MVVLWKKVKKKKKKKRSHQQTKLLLLLSYFISSAPLVSYLYAWRAQMYEKIITFYDCIFPDASVINYFLCIPNLSISSCYNK